MKLKEYLVKIRRSHYVKKILKKVFLLASKLPTRKKTIVFESFLGKQYSDNPKALYLYIKEKYPEFQLYWSFDRQEAHKFKNKKLDILPRFSIKWIFTLARAEYWVTNSRLPLWIPKPKGTTYVQTWHGTPLKRLASDMDEVHMPGTSTSAYKANFLKEAEKWDYLVSPNSYSTNIFKRAFQFKGKIIESGYPRNDLLLNENKKKIIQSLKDKNKIPLDKKVILYAPTWRDNQYYQVGKYKFDLAMDLERMRDEFESEYVIVLRLHYLISENINLGNYKDFVYDFSAYEDINELYLMADILITDYSSVFFDYANLKRPIIFYAYDLDEYRDKLRGFYFDFEKKAPGPLVRTTEHLIRELRGIERKHFKVESAFDDFHQEFCYLEDGLASKRVTQMFIEQ